MSFLDEQRSHIHFKKRHNIRPAFAENGTRIRSWANSIFEKSKTGFTHHSSAMYGL